MSDATAVEQLEELQGEIEDCSIRIYHAIDAVASASRASIDDLENEIEEARQYAVDMKRKAERMLRLLESIRDESGVSLATNHRDRRKHELSDELMEIRRYVRPNPEYVKEQLGVMLNRFNGRYTRLANGRVRRNILFGLRFIVVDPEILRGYLYGASLEIRGEADRREKEKDE